MESWHSVGERSDTYNGGSSLIKRRRVQFEPGEPGMELNWDAHAQACQAGVL